MDRQQILDLYEWAPGVCFRHPAQGEQTTALVKTLHPRTGGDEELRACAECILHLEAERERAAAAGGVGYKPGPGGDNASPNSGNGRP